jgi:hypothetical protein
MAAIILACTCESLPGVSSICDDALSSSSRAVTLLPLDLFGLEILKTLVMKSVTFFDSSASRLARLRSMVMLIAKPTISMVNALTRPTARRFLRTNFCAR